MTRREDTVISIFSAVFPPCEIVANTRTHFFSAEKHEYQLIIVHDNIPNNQRGLGDTCTLLSHGLRRFQKPEYEGGKERTLCSIP